MAEENVMEQGGLQSQDQVQSPEIKGGIDIEALKRELAEEIKKSSVETPVKEEAKELVKEESKSTQEVEEIKAKLERLERRLENKEYLLDKIHEFNLPKEVMELVNLEAPREVLEKQLEKISKIVAKTTKTAVPTMTQGAHNENYVEALWSKYLQRLKATYKKR